MRRGRGRAPSRGGRGASRGASASSSRAVMDNSSRGGAARLPLDQAASRYFGHQEPGGGSSGARRPLSAYNPAQAYPRPSQLHAQQLQQQRFNAAANNRLVAAQAPQWPPASNGSFGTKRSFANDYQDDFHNQANRFAKTVDKSKGLRHFSAKVCEKVKEKGQTNYNEVAEELVHEYFDSLAMPVVNGKQNDDVKNIRRRVYDALNVLIAMNIVEKERKEIRWVGLPDSSEEECRRLREEKAIRAERIKEKTDVLLGRVSELVAYKSLVEKNRERERTEGRPANGSSVYLPFVTVNTDKRRQVDWEVSDDSTKYKFYFQQHFEIQDDIEVLKRLGLSQGMDAGGGGGGLEDGGGEAMPMSEEMLRKIQQCVPQSLRGYVLPILEGSFAPTQTYQRSMDDEVDDEEEEEQPVFAPPPAPRPMARANRAQQAPPAPMPAHRFVPAHSVLQQQQQQRYAPVAGPSTARQPQERYAYARAAPSTGRSQQQQYQQYGIRQQYAPAQQLPYSEEAYDDEEEEEDGEDGPMGYHV